ncbi:MAG: hypothetical protein EBR82_56370 [Caulobacteraceae bacterium]|nr:hypothetical protein [Caulobacteraceae bacterium]
MRKLKAILAFVRNQEWVDEPKWNEEDEKAWTAFLGTPTGRRISLILLNLTLRQNSSAVMKEGSKLAEACGYAKGFRGCVAVLESLATQKLNSAIADYGNESDEPVVN